jgi:alanyl-tRNA synthetase
VASGVRRIEAVTGSAALAYSQKNSKILQDTANLLRENPEAVPQRIEKILSLQKSLEKEVEQLKVKVASLSAGETEVEIKTINGIKVMARKVLVDNPAALRDLADRLRDKMKSGIVVLGSLAGSKVLLITVVTKDLTDRFHAGNIINQVASIVGGSGGGRPDMAQAGGTKPEKLDEALEKVYEVVDTS